MRFFKLICVVALIWVGFKLVDLFVWQTPVELGEQTTNIAAPLAADGLPNYALAILEKHREGVTAENNAAIPMWQAVGPAEMSEQDFALVCKSLGMARVPAPPFLVDVSGEKLRVRMVNWLIATHADANADQAAEPAPSDEPVYAPEDGTELIDREPYEVAFAQLLDRLYDSPWTAADAPPLAEWVKENEKSLDLLVVAAARSKFYSPPPNVLADPETTVMAMMLPHTQAARSVARSLAVRASFRAGNGDLAPAWQDCLACWRFGDHLDRGPTLVDQLVGIAMRGIAARATVALLQSPELPSDLAQQILADLNVQTDRVDVASTLDTAERFMFLDHALRMTTDRLGGSEEFKEFGPTTKVDSNIILRRGNQWYDRLAAAAAIDDFRKRQEAMDRFDADLESLGSPVTAKFFPALIPNLFSRTARSEATSDILIALLLPATSAAVAAENRDENILQLTRIAAALAVYRAENGEYPETLDALAPTTITRTPLDPYSGKPFIYERRGNGYALYSVFENGVDDGGDDFRDPIVDGEWLTPQEQEEFSAPAMENSDLVIRVPLPPLPSIESLVK